jgi:hypothetical protein
MLSNKKTELDYTNAITNAHNEKDRATNVVSVNSLVPARYGKVEVDYYSDGSKETNVSQARYYSEGQYQETKIILTGDQAGSAHKTTINFINRTAESLAGRAFVVHDNIGAVKVWYNVDFSNTEPEVTNTYRSIQVNLLSSHNHETIANRTALALDLDSEFLAIYSMYYVIISSTSVGVKQDSYAFNSSLIIKNTKGTDAVSLNNKYFYINSALDSSQYYVWYNVNGEGSDPVIAGKTPLMVAISKGSNAIIVAEATKSALDSTTKFITNIDGDSLTITNKLIGETSSSVDVSTGFLILNKVEGKNRELLITLIMTYTEDGNIKSVERL